MVDTKQCIIDRGYCNPQKTKWVDPHGREIWQAESNNITCMYFKIGSEGQVLLHNLSLARLIRPWENYNHTFKELYRVR